MTAILLGERSLPVTREKTSGVSLTVTLPNEQRIEIPKAVLRWSRGQEFAVENVVIEQHTRGRLQHYVNQLVQEAAEIIL